MIVDMMAHTRTEYRHTMGHKHLGFSDERLDEMFREAGFGPPDVRVIRAESQAKGPGLFAAVGRIDENKLSKKV